mmetsp:Transcript_18968/g.31078  ORF Transcript_18968/g.31078 Transcript_18968/m.31078 type:complete len:224 (-) Transcript_18968:1187-1858(-)
MGNERMGDIMPFMLAITGSALRAVCLLEASDDWGDVGAAVRRLGGVAHVSAISASKSTNGSLFWSTTPLEPLLPFFASASATTASMFPILKNRVFPLVVSFAVFRVMLARPALLRLRSVIQSPSSSDSSLPLSHHDSFLTSLSEREPFSAFFFLEFFEGLGAGKGEVGRCSTSLRELTLDLEEDLSVEAKPRLPLVMEREDEEGACGGGGEDGREVLLRGDLL